MNPLISIIIVNYNSGNLLYNCLESIEAELEGISYEAIIADNASTDNSIGLCNEFKEKTHFKFILSRENLGFAKGCNLGASAAEGEILHFLNPDTQLRPGVANDYRKVAANPEIVYVNPVINRDGSIENGKMVIPFLRDIFWWNISGSKARYWFKGASVIVSRENFNKVGRWNEEYFMFVEDLDLFYNFWKHSIGIAKLPTPIFHYGGGCSKNVWSNMQREIIVQKSFRKFFRRHSNIVHYTAVKIYFILHNLVKRPKKALFDIKAWIKSYRGRC